MNNKIRYHFTSPRLGDYERSRPLSFGQKVYCIAVLLGFALLIALALYSAVMNEAIELAVTMSQMSPLKELVEAIQANPLKPENWQALGKALGWDTKFKVYKCLEHSKGDDYWSFAKFCMDCAKPLVEFERITNKWKNNALQYFELKLTGGDEEKFWSELLKEAT